MLTLYLLRHAKSSWEDASKQDFERPLANRGRKACVLIGEFIEEKGIDLELVLISTSVRTRETVDLVRERAKFRCELRYDERIYDATASQLLAIISQIDNDRKSVMLVGHNPGLEDLLVQLTGEQVRVTTATLAKVKFKAQKWSASLVNKGALEWVVRPKELARS